MIVYIYALLIKELLKSDYTDRLKKIIIIQESMNGLTYFLKFWRYCFGIAVDVVFAPHFGLLYWISFRMHLIDDYSLISRSISESKKGCDKAYSAVILCPGNRSNMRLSRSRAWGLIDLYWTWEKSKSQVLFWASI
jgi:hypothetical protein